MFVLPFGAALPAALLFEISEVIETLPAMLTFTLLFLTPISLLQVVGTGLKSRAELSYWHERGELSISQGLDVIHRHLSVVTLRGWILLGGGVMMALSALALRWASLGTIAVVILLLFYTMVGWTLFVSTFLVRTFEGGLGRQGAGITRQMRPAVALAGDPVEEVVLFRNVPVPLGYVLLVEDPNPPRLSTESRYGVGASARHGVVEARGLLRATPRGNHRLGPARILYQDLLGITRVSVASVATAELKILPRLQPVVIEQPPRSSVVAPDILTKPHRFATEDHFRFRGYLPGDDTRRIHWRLSMKAGRLQVRLPETREVSSEQVMLLLDCFLPEGKLLDAAHGGETILDSLVLAWIGIAHELVERGHRVTLVAAAPDRRGGWALQRLEAKRGTLPRWQDLGSRIEWQAEFDLPQMLGEIGESVHGVVVTARFTAPPPGPLPGQSATWLMMDPATALGEADPHWLFQVVGRTPLRWLRWLLLRPHPPGSEDNHLVYRLRRIWSIQRRWRARRQLRSIAQRRAGQTLAELEARGDAIYRIERGPTHVRLVGLRRATPGRAGPSVRRGP
ncbi:MAG TPA: DUF58 domain-containing protein [Deltaproteobacteria bacterium]|nr:DUF58 domain-containing protein [Deltaproteobacteria bacterium]